MPTPCRIIPGPSSSNRIQEQEDATRLVNLDPTPWLPSRLQSPSLLGPCWSASSQVSEKAWSPSPFTRLRSSWVRLVRKRNRPRWISGFSGLFSSEVALWSASLCQSNKVLDQIGLQPEGCCRWMGQSTNQLVKMLTYVLYCFTICATHPNSLASWLFLISSLHSLETLSVIRLKWEIPSLPLNWVSNLSTQCGPLCNGTDAKIKMCLQKEMDQEDRTRSF